MKTRSRAAMGVLFLATFATAQIALADEPQINHAEKHIHTTRTVYDAVGTVTTVVDPIGRTTTYQYDAGGSRSMTDTATGNTTTYTYDGLDRATTNGSTYTYDATGSDSTMSTTGGTTSSTYDQAGGTQTDNDALGNVTRYQYDSLGRGTTTETDPLGRTSTYQYDSLNRQTQVTGNDPLGNTTTYQYDSLNRRITMTDALGGVDSNNNDATSSGSADFMVPSVYQYDAMGRVTSMNDGSNLDVMLVDMSTGLTVFQYDALDRDVLGHTTTYQYDPVNGPNTGAVVGPLEGTLQPGRVYRYSYSYDISQDALIPQTGTGNLSMELDLSPIPEPATGGLLLVGATMIGARRRGK